MRRALEGRRPSRERRARPRRRPRAALAQRLLHLGALGRQRARWPRGRTEERRVGRARRRAPARGGACQVERDERAEVVAAHDRGARRRAPPAPRRRPRACSSTVVPRRAPGRRWRRTRGGRRRSRAPRPASACAAGSHRLGVGGQAVDEQHRRAGAVLDHVERDARALHSAPWLGWWHGRFRRHVRRSRRAPAAHGGVRRPASGPAAARLGRQRDQARGRHDGRGHHRINIQGTTAEQAEQIRT